MPDCKGMLTNARLTANSRLMAIYDDIIPAQLTNEHQDTIGVPFVPATSEHGP